MSFCYNLKSTLLQAMLESWLPHHKRYLDKFLQLEWLGELSEPPICTGCESESLGVFRCTCCFGKRMMCQVCIVTLHQSQPLHTIEVHFFLTGFFPFQLNTNLKEMEWMLLQICLSCLSWAYHAAGAHQQQQVQDASEYS